MENDVDREGEVQLLHEGGGRRVFGAPADAGDPLRDLSIGVLDGDLDVLEPGLLQSLGPRRGSARAPDVTRVV